MLRKILHLYLHSHPTKFEICNILNKAIIKGKFDFMKICSGGVKKMTTNLTTLRWAMKRTSFYWVLWINKTSDASLHLLRETPLHIQKITVCCAISTLINQPIFFKTMTENLVTVNSYQYVLMIRNFISPQLVHFPVNKDISFQQDEVTSHTSIILML